MCGVRVRRCEREESKPDPRADCWLAAAGGSGQLGLGDTDDYALPQHFSSSEVLAHLR